MNSVAPAFTGPVPGSYRSGSYCFEKLDCYLPWQVCRHDCTRISQLLRQGTLNVTGQARRQDESSLEHFAKHASTPPVLCPLTPLCASASNVSSESSTTQRPSFIQASPANPSEIQGFESSIFMAIAKSAIEGLPQGG